MPSTLSRLNEIMSSLSHIIVDVKPDIGFEIGQEGIIQLIQQNYLIKWEDLEWRDRLVKLLKTDTQNGICSENDDIARRQEAFGSNTYVNPPTKSFFHFVSHALKDLSIIILLSCAALSLGFGMKVNGAKEGWIDGLGIFLTVFLAIVVSATYDYRHHRQFNHLLKICNNIRNHVFRDGRPREISIFEVVVRDIVLLDIGDQVPANGLLLPIESPTSQ